MAGARAFAEVELRGDDAGRPLEIQPVGREGNYWVAQADGMSSRTKLRQASGDYASSLPSKIAEYSPDVPSAMLADIDEATAALAKFDVYARATLGGQSPSLGPMSAVLLRSESTSSSQIENLTVGARQLALAELDESTGNNAKLVVANVKAMEAALNLAEDLSEQAVLQMHHVLLSRHPGWQDHAGRYRDSLVWIGTSPISPLGASYVAPQPEHVPAAMADLMRFIERDDLPVLMQAAIAHAQFETIHPFSDGNGRTGRALVHAMLKRGGLLENTTAPISAGLLKRTDAYFEALRSFQSGDARPIVEQFANASRFAASSGTELVDSLSEQLERSRESMSKLRPQATAWQVLPHLVAHPVINSAYLTNNLGMSDMAAQRALSQLAEHGVLEERTGLRRNRVWQHPGILRALDEYAESLRRQS